MRRPAVTEVSPSRRGLKPENTKRSQIEEAGHRGVPLAKGTETEKEERKGVLLGGSQRCPPREGD